MDIPIEKVLTTLFAGSLVILSVSILMFIVSGYCPSNSLKIFFQRIFSKKAKPVEYKSAITGDIAKWFFALIAVALIYSSGVTVEHLSDKLTDNSKRFLFWVPFSYVAGDKMIRASAFHRVYNPKLVRELNEDERGLWHDLDSCLKTKCKCNEDILDRTSIKYYRAKNILYGKDNYYKDLDGLQRRIDFMRTLTFTSGIPILALIAGIFLSFVPSFLPNNMLLHNSIGRHWQRLNILNLFYCLVLMAFIWFLSVFAWEHEELQYDLRVFGYYLDSFNEKAAIDYPTIELNGADCYTTFGKYPRFEPSGIARIGNTRHFLVVNDKKEGGSFSIFELTRNDMLIEVDQFELRIGKSIVDLSKLEAITASNKQPGTFYAITAFDRYASKSWEYRKLVRFRLDDSRQPVECEELKLYDPGKKIASHLNYKWSKVEAMALSPDETSLLIGIRAIGESYKLPLYKVIILKYDLKDLLQGPEVIVNVDLNEYLKRPEGISSLEFSHKLNSFLLLTSFEDESRYPPISQVGGHLWIAPRDLSQLNKIDRWKSLERTTFSHKPEGVDMLSSREAIVVFDDDGDRKSTTGEKGKFKLGANEAVFSIVNK
ncbi:MAG: hypothetical protein JRE64_08830 [Deltaproteobacteria bacterium]|nr:hypothetical protein [Deltaproteobacteria bacterium]